MKAKDTVMRDKQILDLIVQWHNKATETNPPQQLDVADLAISVWKTREAEIEEARKAGYDKGYTEARNHCEDVLLPQEKLAGIKEVVEWIEDRIFYCADTPPQEGVAYSYLGNYILRFGKEALPSVGFYELRDSPEWQVFKESKGIGGLNV
jgi:hypothetical protein